jgi:predicted metal-dependent phosphoesterase TrpH
LLRLETHAHTIFSRDSLLRPEQLIAACQRKGIDRIIVTDHNTLSGALRCQRLDPERVIIGEEILTTSGELLAAYVQEEVPPGLSPLEAIQRLRQQGAFISVSHPFDLIRKGHWPLEILLGIAPLIDAIETFNSRCFTASANTQALAFAKEHNLLGTVGSDAHTAFELGRSILLIPEFHDPPSLKAALAQAEPRVRLSSPWVHVTSRYAAWVKSR